MVISQLLGVVTMVIAIVFCSQIESLKKWLDSGDIPIVVYELLVTSD